MRHSLPFHNIHIYPIVQFVALWTVKDSLGRTLVYGALGRHPPFRGRLVRKIQGSKPTDVSVREYAAPMGLPRRRSRGDDVFIFMDRQLAFSR